MNARMLRTLSIAVVAALIGVTISFTVIDVPRMLSAQSISQVMVDGMKPWGLWCAIYIAATLVYGGALLAAARMLKWKALAAYLVVGLLPAIAYGAHVFAHEGVQSGWLSTFIFHAIPATLASVALWLSTIGD